jgi:hypothetical protein
VAAVVAGTVALILGWVYLRRLVSERRDSRG